MTALIRLISALSRFCGGVAAALLVTIVVLVCQMVALRYGFGEPATWQAELVTYLVIALTFIASPYVLVTRGHVNMDVLPRYLGRRGRALLALVAALLSLGFCVGVTWAGVGLLREAIAEGWRSDAVAGVGLWIPYVALPIGIGLLALQYLADILGYLSGREPSVEFEPSGQGAPPADGPANKGGAARRPKALGRRAVS
jgi:TRAP-type C4-dicarboxylate transport system permease small subunit